MKKKYSKIILIGVLLGLFFLHSINIVDAQETGTGDLTNHIVDSQDQGSFSRNIAQFCSWIGLGMAKFLGWILTLLTDGVIRLFQFKDYKIGGVDTGWMAVRDICNMFFILVLLIIAFATILRYENYSIKRLLPKLIIMAILINFSKTICLLLIDFSNVIMLTFSNAFVTTGAGQFVSMLGLKNLMQINTVVGNKIQLESWNIFAAIMLADAILILTIIVLIMFIIILLARIIMFWILIILSPIAFFASVLPSTNKYASQWWGEFSKYLIIGPAIGFFTWLSFTVAISGSPLANLGINGGNAQSIIESVSAFGKWDNLARFMLGIGLLIGTLKISQQIGAVGAGVGMNMANRVKNTSKNWGGKGIKKFSGYNAVADRIKAFNTARRAESSSKAEATGRKLFGLYSGAKGAASGTVKGLRRATVGRGPTVTDSFVGKYTGLQAIRAWKNNKQAREDERNRKIEALNTGVYKDEKGREFKKGEKGFKSMSKTQAEFIAGWRDGTRKSRGIVNQIEAEKINKEQQDMLDSGASITELASVLESKTAPRDKKAAAAITLAIKEGFKSRDQVKRAKEGIGANAPLMKKFEDILHKRFAHLDFDLSVNEKGEFNNKTDVEKFHDRIDEGVVDGANLHHSFYEKEGNIRALKDYYGVGFASKLDLAAGRTKKAREAVKAGLTEAKISDIRSGDEERALVNEKTGEINSFAKTLARINGDYVTAFSNSSDSGKIVFDESSQKAATKFFETAKPTWLDNANTDNLRIDKVEKDYGVGREDAENIVKSMEQAVADGVNGSKLVNMSRGGYSPEFVSRSIGIIHDRYGNKGERYEVEIKNNNILNNIKETKPDSENTTQ